MVPRSNLLQAQSEAKASREEKQAAAESMARLQAQLNDARVETAKLQAEMSGMVPRSSFDAARKQVEDVEATAEAERARLTATIQALNEKLSALGDEKGKLVLAAQVVERAFHMQR
jgi:K+-transporting ATPase c subunit